MHSHRFRCGQPSRIKYPGVMTVAMAMLLAIAAASVAAASDYFNTCKSADDQYVMDDGALYRAAGKEQATKLTFATLERQVLSERAGHCIAEGPGAAGQKFAFLGLKSRILVEIDTPSGTKRAKMTCELASDGMPAAFKCGREVLERNVQSPGPNVRYAIDSPGVWTHNGSVMTLKSSGTARWFKYMNPRKGMREVGVSGDTTIFSGERKGNRYVGDASYFTKSCGIQSFPVTGTVSKDEHRVELTGSAPRLDGNCQQAGTITERLVFTRNP